MQEEALGLGHAVLTGPALVDDQPFAVLLADDLIDPSVPLLRDLLAASERTDASVIAAMRVGQREISMYGCIGPGETDGDLVRVVSIVEKPDPDDAPSDLAVIGRYVFTPDIVDALGPHEPGSRRGDPADRRDRGARRRATRSTPCRSIAVATTPATRSTR